MQACPAPCEGDVGKVRQVAINLLSNAVKFTERGRIVVRASSHPIAQDRHSVVISVEDTGPGIAPENIDRIFEAFDQAESVVRTGGTGLGLTISRNFARLMHGDLTVESVIGKGSVFTFSFEAGAASTADAPADTIHPIPLRLAPNQLPREGADRGRCADQSQAARRLVIRDWLPDQDGFEWCGSDRRA